MREQTVSQAGVYPRALDARAGGESAAAQFAIEARDFNFYYGGFRALEHITMAAPRHQITALIGPSGTGKSTLLRAMNRMHDETPGTSCEGALMLEGQDINAFADLIALRKRVGMIFQRPNPFPMSIFENVAYGLRLNAQRVPKDAIAAQVEHALRGAALWDEVKDKLQQSGLALSGGQQQRLCIARAIAVEPAVLLMDEPCAALDPIATLKIEELMTELVSRYTIVIVTHNLQQAGRVSEQTIFLSMNPDTRAGFVVEAGLTQEIFTSPQDPRTLAYISGRFG
ncbi:MAG: phosphate ABC transporter ATP-binding protein PstB [Chloroflexales bacterium]